MNNESVSCWTRNERERESLWWVSKRERDMMISWKASGESASLWCLTMLVVECNKLLAYISTPSRRQRGLLLMAFRRSYVNHGPVEVDHLGKRSIEAPLYDVLYVMLLLLLSHISGRSRVPARCLLWTQLPLMSMHWFRFHIVWSLNMNLFFRFNFYYRGKSCNLSTLSWHEW